MEQNINSALLAIAGHWDLHVNGLAGAHGLVARHAEPYVLESFEIVLDEYVTVIGSKRFNEILDAMPDEYWDNKCDDDLADIRSGFLQLPGANKLTVVLVTHIWCEYRLMSNEHIWLDLQDLVNHFIPEPETADVAA